jgi:hypothetical protein
MELYNLTRGDKFIISDGDVKVPPAAPVPDKSVTYVYTHVDGMYAPCEGSDGERYYFAAWTKVEKV